MARRYWLLKTEPDEYGWDDLVRDGRGRWDGVRNYAARNHLRAMRAGDWAFFYHTGKAREIVGVAEVVREHYPDPSAEKGDFSAVDVVPVCPLDEAVPLSTIKNEASLREMILVRQSRLSVQPVTPAEFKKIIALSGTELSEK